MDHLREGIHLRAMGQKDPASEWQREGYEMFGLLMASVAFDFVRYVMHTDVVPTGSNDTQVLTNVTASKSEATSARGAGPSAVAPNEPVNRTPVVKSELERLGRNDPCHCGSGRKYKQCHGRTAATE